MRLNLLIAGGALLGACGGGSSTIDAGDAGDAASDARADAAPRTIADLPAAAPQQIAGLDGPVDVVVDRYGWPHIYATTLRDAMFTQGLLEARDRMPQMELLRRVASGTLAEAFGSIAPQLVDQDIAARVVGLRRTAQAMWDMTPAGRVRGGLEAYAAGVNQALAEIRNGDRTAAAGTELVVHGSTPAWTPVDSLVVARYQAFALSYDPEVDIEGTAEHDAARATFDTAAAGTPAAARHGLYWDMNPFASPSTAAVIPDFYSSMGTAGSTYRPAGRAPRLAPGVVARARPFLGRVRDMLNVVGREGRGSNNWVVAASSSATGHALLANDPHLSLTAPGVWWGVHFTVTGGSDAVDVAGVSFPGIPGVVLGYNRRLAWGATVAYYDVTDVYRETVTPGVGGAPDTVLFNGAQVPIQTIIEHVPSGTGGTIDVPIEIVPHHGPIVPTIVNGRVQPRTGTTALSIRWTGHQPTRDLDAFVGLWYAGNVAEGRAAMQSFDVGAQNWVLADVDGHIGYTSHALVPVRDARARTWDPGARPGDPAANLEGTLPCMVLPGTGEAEWTGYVDSTLLPNAIGSATRPWIATANNDQVGNSFDNNPLNDRAFLNCRWAEGFREERIHQRLMALGTRMSREDLEAIQDDSRVLAAGRFRPFIADAFARVAAEWTTPGTHAELQAVASATRPRMDALRDAAARLAAWSLDSPSGLEANATDATRRDAVAASLFHTWLGYFFRDAFKDEYDALGRRVTGDALRGALFLLEHPDMARTRDATTMQSAVWDDLTTPAVVETRDAVIIRALDEAVTRLAERFATPDRDRWLWGTLHTLRFDSLVPGPGAALSIPAPNDPTFPLGFPRQGGLDTVDVATPGLLSNVLAATLNFPYAHGPSQRFTVDMDPGGPQGFNALPGGQVFDRASPHFSDEAELWRINRTHPIPRNEAEVVANYETRLRFAPAQ